MQHDIGGDFELVAVVIAGTIHKHQDELPGVLLGQCLQKNLEAFCVGRRHDQIDASSILRADCAVEVDVFANELGGDLRPDALRRPARPRPVHPAEPRFVGKHGPHPAAAPGSRAGNTADCRTLRDPLAHRPPRPTEQLQCQSGMASDRSQGGAQERNFQLCAQP